MEEEIEEDNWDFTMERDSDGAVNLIWHNLPVISQEEGDVFAKGAFTKTLLETRLNQLKKGNKNV